MSHLLRVSPKKVFAIVLSFFFLSFFFFNISNEFIKITQDSPCILHIWLHSQHFTFKMWKHFGYRCVQNVPFFFLIEKHWKNISFYKIASRSTTSRGSLKFVRVINGRPLHRRRSPEENETWKAITKFVLFPNDNHLLDETYWRISLAIPIKYLTLMNLNLRGNTFNT